MLADSMVELAASGQRHGGTPVRYRTMTRYENGDASGVTQAISARPAGPPESPPAAAA